jgi:transcriptional regulator GlxA family with amidase domain
VSPPAQCRLRSAYRPNFNLIDLVVDREGFGNYLEVAERRDLQYRFEDITGLSPLAFMRATCLNGERRLLRYEPGPVGHAAYARGFNHLSQFAQDYRKQFGQLRSQTASRQI